MAPKEMITSNTLEKCSFKPALKTTATTTTNPVIRLAKIKEFDIMWLCKGHREINFPIF